MQGEAASYGGVPTEQHMTAVAASVPPWCMRAMRTNQTIVGPSMPSQQNRNPPSQESSATHKQQESSATHKQNTSSML